MAKCIVSRAVRADHGAYIPVACRGGEHPTTWAERTLQRARDLKQAGAGSISIRTEYFDDRDPDRVVRTSVDTY